MCVVACSTSTSFSPHFAALEVGVERPPAVGAHVVELDAALRRLAQAVRQHPAEDLALREQEPVHAALDAVAMTIVDSFDQVRVVAVLSNELAEPFEAAPLRLDVVGATPPRSSSAPCLSFF